MDVTYNLSSQAPTDARPPGPSTPPGRLRPALLALLPLGLILWAVGVAQTNTAALGPYGLPAALPLIFYAGLALVIVSAGIEFGQYGRQRQPSQPWLAAHAVGLVVILYGTAPLVYKDGRYSWLYKTIGVVQYVGAHGSLNRSIDIYQNWPGFFALAAWFDGAAGVSSPIDYAKWAQLVFELAAIPLLYSIYQSLSLPVWHRWLAIMLYAGSNWIAQDYFSPQGMSTLLSLGVMAVMARWMLTVDAPGGRPRGRDAVAAELRRSLPFILTLLFLFLVLTASHELSPYIVIIQLASLSVVGLARPRWIALAVAVIAIVYLLPSFSYVNGHYGLTSSVGSFFSNVQPPSSSSKGAGIPVSQKIIGDCTRLLSAGIWLLALVGAWRCRRSRRRLMFALLLLTFTPVLVLVAGAYGNEGLLRVYLFSLPWAVALVGYAVAPRPAPGPDRTAVGAAHRAERPAHAMIRAVVLLGLAVALFFPSFFGNDAADVMTPSEVNTVLAFLQSARPGPLLAVTADAPASDTANYDQFPVGTIFDPAGIVPDDVAIAEVPAYVARTMVRYVPGEPVYIVMTPSMTAYNAAYGVTQPSRLTGLLAGLATSPYWKLAVSDDGTEIYRMTAAASSLPPGSYATNVVLGVP